ncbi:MAG: bifunctional diaminohydroxyphosphoribosylaminopyrimidine deaminase/5-amino-6-(5-phosphoribosylamino)uracil reductase RibD [Schleiferiaceae bacterium]|nr:bifunctional diaminohydroxyphosphoribosylaminopyrimidine deaminase/5-amino-6-(5-phosphoribosylamino)uracil reductase RibD [Schleiferiaceae bacterium]
MTHSEGILRCLQLARKAGGYVHPNPWVGAIIVHEGRIIAEGYHHKAGQAHAEVDALKKVSDQDQSLLSEAIMYVNLEPCAHIGKTPPCANAIVDSGLTKVVVGTLDPNPVVAGQGVEILLQAGIDVHVGVEETACRWLNRRFFHSIETGRPYILLKWAESPDGFLDGVRSIEHPGPFRISNDASRALVHSWRSLEAGILVGWGTYMQDEPELSVRDARGPQPQRILWSSRGRWDVAPGWWLWQAKNSPTPWKVFERLARESGLRSILVEGGSATLQALMDAGLYDEIRVIKGQNPLGDGLVGPIIPADALRIRPGDRPADECPEAIGDNPIKRYLSPTFKG